MSVNNVTLVGEVFEEPTLNYTGSGTAVLEFTVLTVEDFKKKDGTPGQNKEWTKVRCWGKFAEAYSSQIYKGSKVYCEGKLQTDSWEGKDGTKKYKTVVELSKIELALSNPSMNEQVGW